MMNIIKRLVWVLGVFMFSGVLFAQGQAPKAEHPAAAPLTEKELLKEIKSAAPQAVISMVKDRGVDFEMTPEIEKKLHKAKATDEVVSAVRAEGPKARAQMAKMNMAGAGVQDIPKEQALAFGAIRGELNADKQIALVDDFVTKYPSSPLLSYVYTFGAGAYQQKGNVEKLVEYADKGLKIKPDNLLCLLLKVDVLPQPQYISKHEVDKDKILQDTQTEAAQALQLIAQLPKQPNESDVDFQKRTAQAAADVHSALGMVHLELASNSLSGMDKSELVKAETEYKAATATDHPDARDYFRLGECYSMEGKLDDAIQAFTKASETGKGTAIQPYADQKIADLNKLKAQKPAAPKP